MKYLCRLWVEEEGQTLVEYVMIIALIAIVSIAAMSYVGGRVSNSYNSSCNRL